MIGYPAPLTVDELISELIDLPGNLPVYLHYHDNGEECYGPSLGVQGMQLRPAVWL